MPDPVPEPADLTGRTFGDFDVLRKLGQGGMGAVYLARQRSLKRDVALKFLRADHAANPTALQRFQAEAEAVARVTHANIVQVYAVGEHDGQRYMALEYVDGRNLRDYLARRGPPDLPVALTVLKQVAAALQRASEMGLVHRDVKPENILITRKAEVKVADFGLSRYFAGDGQPLNLTQSGVALGTPLYMSPEQVQGQPVDHRSDLYSFGVTAYHLLAGHPPFTGNSPFDVAIQHVQNAAPPLAESRPDLPADLCGVVHKLMAKAPADRYQTARDVLRDLAKVQKGRPLGTGVSASLPALSVPTASTSQAAGLTVGNPFAFTTASVPTVTPPRNWSAIARRAAGGLAVLAVACGGWWAFGRAHPHPEHAGHPAAAGPGLPDARPPDLLPSARERELQAKVASRTAKAGEVFDATLALGVLYVREGKLDKAARVFKEVENRPPAAAKGGGAAKGAGAPVFAGKLGQAVVLAYQDKARESVDLFKEAVGEKRVQASLDRFLLARPEFAEAVADALNRDADNLAPESLPAALDWLRTPAGLVRGPKGG